MLSVAPAFFAMTKHLFATAISMPAAISSIGLPSPTSVMTSDSANTVHCAVIGMTFFAPNDSFEKSSRLISKLLAIASKNLPVPAEHLSFIAKFLTVPSVSMLMPFTSCPPISMIALTVGSVICTPIAWQEISDMFSSANGTLFLPYPVPIRYARSFDEFSSGTWFITSCIASSALCWEFILLMIVVSATIFPVSSSITAFVYVDPTSQPPKYFIYYFLRFIISYSV